MATSSDLKAAANIVAALESTKTVAGEYMSEADIADIIAEETGHAGLLEAVKAAYGPLATNTLVTASDKIALGLLLEQAIAKATEHE